MLHTPVNNIIPTRKGMAALVAMVVTADGQVRSGRYILCVRSQVSCHGGLQFYERLDTMLEVVMRFGYNEL